MEEGLLLPCLWTDGVVRFVPTDRATAETAPPADTGRLLTLLDPSDTRDVDRTPNDTRKTPSKGATRAAEAGHVDIGDRSFRSGAQVPSCSKLLPPASQGSVNSAEACAGACAGDGKSMRRGG